MFHWVLQFDFRVTSRPIFRNFTLENSDTAIFFAQNSPRDPNHCENFDLVLKIGALTRKSVAADFFLWV